MRRDPLDLRLLPAAAVCWAVALLAIVSSARIALGLGTTLLGVSVLTAAGVWASVQRPGRREDSRASTIRLVAVQIVMCFGLAGGVALSTGLSQHQLEHSGWTEAVTSDLPLTVTVRLRADPQPIATESFAGEPRQRAEVHVLDYREAGESQPESVDTSAVLFTDAGEELKVGARYQTQVMVSPADQDERATAVLRPFTSGHGDHWAQEVGEDAWSTVQSHFAQLRSATVDHASVAIADAPGLLPGVILGDRSAQATELTEAMQVAGLSHMTVVSGTHCALVMGALLGSLRLLRAPRWTIPPILLLGLGCFVMLVQPAPSVIRAAVMGAIGALAVFAGRGRASSALLTGCVILLLLYDPWYATEAAFQLSVAATAGIVLIGTRLDSALRRWLPKIISAPLALAIAAQLFVTPVLLPLAEGITVYSIPANILAGPLLPLVTVPGTAAAVVSTLMPWLSQSLLWLAGFPAAGIAWVGRTVDQLPQALAPWPEGWLGTAATVLYVLAALMVCYRVISHKRLPVAAVAAVSTAIGIVAAIILPLSVLWSSGVPAQWRVALCDVGQGDMLVLRTAANAAIVIDAGEEPDPAAACLQDLDIDVVETLMITHEHVDHYGGSSGIAATAEVQQILYSGSAGFSVNSSVEEHDGTELDVEERRAQPGETGQSGGEYPLHYQVVAAPDYHAEANDNSLVLVAELLDIEKPAGADRSANDPLRLLATGDLEEEIARLMKLSGELPADIDLLKVSHHGALNGGTDILKHTRPEAALIGVGEDNPYGHPHPEILRTLEGLGASVYRTDRHGTVAFSLTESGWKADQLK